MIHKEPDLILSVFENNNSFITMNLKNIFRDENGEEER